MPALWVSRTSHQAAVRRKSTSTRSTRLKRSRMVPESCRARRRRQRQALTEKLHNKPRRRSSESGANAKLMTPPQSVGKCEIRDVRASD